MAYDPNFPPDHQTLNAAPFRDQFNALKALSDAQQAQIDAQQATIDDQGVQIGDMLAAINALQGH